jgi:pimeloyl-ACP methyl ester carboxylesterase
MSTGKNAGNSFGQGSSSVQEANSNFPKANCHSFLRISEGRHRDWNLMRAVTPRDCRTVDAINAVSSDTLCDHTKCVRCTVTGGKMARPLVLIHGYSADGLDFKPLCRSLQGRGIAAQDINIGNYVSLNNEITIKDIAEGLDRALRNNPALNGDQPFDAIVHSTGMLVIRSWLTNYGASVNSNARLKRLKHLIGLAPATWGSPQAHKGRTWLGALVKGNKNVGPDFLNAGDAVLDGLELGSRFTWELAHADLLGDTPHYGKGTDTPYVCVFIGNEPYTGLSSVANDPGTDGTVRWAGCGLNARKIVVDLTRTPIGEDGQPTSRVSITPWADDRLDIPMIPVAGKNHATLIAEPDDAMVQLVSDFLKVGEQGQITYEDWLTRAKAFGAPSFAKMLVNPGKAAAGVGGEFKSFFGHLFKSAEDTMEGWQQFVVHARDERGDGITDFLVEVLRKENDDWVSFEEMYTDVHAYRSDLSYRCFHIRLPKGITTGAIPIKLRIHASSGTELVAYQGYGINDDGKKMTADTAPVDIDLTAMKGGTLFYPFTTTLVEIILNREPAPLDRVSRIFQFL